MTSCLRSGGGGRSYGFDVVKSTSTSWSRSLQSSSSTSPSSTLSESSNSPPFAISIKRARTPRKRPNQTYNEATAILSATYPAIFPAIKTPRASVSIPTNPFHPFPEPLDLLLPPLPVLNDAAFLISNPNPPSPAAATHFHLKRKTHAAVSTDSAESPASDVSWEPNSPAHPIGEDFDAVSLLEAEVKQGIDSIIGTLAIDTPITDAVDSLLRSLVERRIPSSFELGFESQWALRKRDEDERWSSKVVPVSDITPNYKVPLSPATVVSQKKNKKVEEEEEIDVIDSEQGRGQPALGLKLNHEEVLRHWADRRSVFSDRPGSPNSLVDATVSINIK